MTALATTGLTEYWGDGDELHLLGSWCLPPAHGHAVDRRRTTMLACPWDDPAELARARYLLERLHESTLAGLMDYLNSVHGTARSLRYWRIVLGPWLIEHIHPLYDRYVHLVRALEATPDPDTVVMAAESWRTPRGTYESVQLVLDHPYNLQLYSQVLAALGLTFRERPFTWPASPARERLRVLARAAARRVLSRDRFGRWPAGVLVEMYADPAAVRTLAAGAGFGVRRMPGAPAPRPALDARRLGLAQAVAGESEFERVLAATLPTALPTVFLEGYRAAASPMEARARRTRVVASANAWLFQDAFKLGAAAAGETGARLLGVQHGGAYGMAEWMPFEDHEAAVSDVYFVWGWADGKPTLVNMPSIKFAAAAHSRRRGRPVAGPRVMLVTTAHPPYLYRFQSYPLGAQWDRYVEWQRRFVAALGPVAANELVVRLDRPDYGRDQQAPLLAVKPDLRFDRRGDFYDVAAASACVVVDHCTTVFLEAMHLDVPTVVFWDPVLWPLRDSARPFLELLGRARIYHPTPEGAAALLDEFAPDYASWWRSPEVREARDAFLNRYALQQPAPLDAWAQQLRREVALAR